ncbi:MAG TPA: hypothetical protein VLK78_08805 [Candidatus Angelobacter sp.]|nr:hypothetical protein [Candidatus Angelobacter sp.]
MRTYAWLVGGILLGHQSLSLFPRLSSGSELLSVFILNPLVFIQVALLILTCLLLVSYAFREGIFSLIHNDSRTHYKLICGMIYSSTLLVGWGWLVLTSLWGGAVIITLTTVHFISLLER